MKIVHQIADIRDLVRREKRAGRAVGLVPTMGYLHEGHLALMRQAREDNEFVVATIFVNPIQFGPQEDYAVYPRDLQRDAELAASTGIDVVFAPAVEEMYPAGAQNVLGYVDVRHITERLCGASRPGHFRGVATVVTKLFNIVEPDNAYFGQKDAQQVVVIKRMVQDLNMNVHIHTVPIVREQNGLALSSRNSYLNPAERAAATVLSQSLQLAFCLLEKGERDAAQIGRVIAEHIRQEPLADIEYISVCNSETLDELTVIADTALIALAVRIGKIRLIDNLIWGEPNAAQHV